MAPRDDDFATLITAGVLGLGGMLLAANAYQNNQERRQAFTRALDDALRGRGLQMVSANFGRGPGNRPFWNVTLEDLWQGVRTVRIDLPTGTPPYAPSTCKTVADRVVAAAA